MITTEQSQQYPALSRLAKSAVYDDVETGPYSGEQAAKVSGMDKLIAAIAKVRDKHIGHYLLNPFAPGPVTEGFGRYDRRYEAAAGRGYGSAITGNTPTAIARLLQIAHTAGASASAVAPLASANLIAAMVAPPILAATGGKKTQLAAHKAHEAVNEPYKTDNELTSKMMHSKNAAEGGPIDLPLAGAVTGMDDWISGIRRNRKEHFGHYMLNPYVSGPVREALARTLRRVYAGMHGSWAGQIGAVPTAGLLPLILGNDAAKQRAREHFARQITREEAKIPTDATEKYPALAELAHR